MAGLVRFMFIVAIIASTSLQSMVFCLGILPQFRTYLTEAELTVNLRAVEVKTILFEGNALNICGGPTINEGHIDALFLQCCLQFFPVLASGNCGNQSIVYLILHGIRPTKPFTVNVVFALRHV